MKSFMKNKEEKKNTGGWIINWITDFIYGVLLIIGYLFYSHVLNLFMNFVDARVCAVILIVYFAISGMTEGGTKDE